MIIKDFYDKLDECFASNDVAGAASVLEDYYKKAKAMDDTSLICAVLSERMGFYRGMGKEEEALSSVRLMEELIEKEELDKHIDGTNYATMLINMGTTKSRFGLYEEGLVLYDEAMKLLQGSEDYYLLASLSNNMSSAYEGIGESEKAIDSYKAAISFLDHPGILSYYKAITYANMAACYEAMGDEKGQLSSVQMMDEIVDRLFELVDPGFASCLNKCAMYHEHLGHVERAEYLRKRAEEIYSM